MKLSKLGKQKCKISISIGVSFSKLAYFNIASVKK